MRPKVWIGAWMFVISQTFALAQAPVHVKSWVFTLAHGTVQIDLQNHQDGTSSLHIGPDQQGHEAPIAEQVDPLRQVLAEMPGLGVDPHKLTYIGKLTFGYGDDVTEKLAYSCADSKECRFTIQTPEEEKTRVLIELLNQSGAFEPYNEAFKGYGIRVHVTEAEKITLIHFSSVPPRNSRDRANGRMLVLGGASVGMRFSPIDATPNQLVFATKECFAKGGIGIVSTNLYINLKSEKNELVLSAGSRWTGQGAATREAEIFFDDKIWSPQALPNGFDLSKSVVISFEGDKVRFFDFGKMSGGYYKRPKQN